MSDGIEVPPGEATPLEWPDPQPLVSKVLSEPYPIDALPQTIRAAVKEVLGFVKAPAPLVASSALGALSLAIQAHCDIQRADKLSGPSSLFLLTIAESGERKSTCDGFFTQAIRDYESHEAEAGKPFLKTYQAAFESWESERNGLKDALRSAAKAGKDISLLKGKLIDAGHAKPIKPRVPRLLYGDVTPESLKWSLATVWPAAGVISSEAGLVLGSSGMGSDSVMRNLATLNLLWDGSPITTDRRTSESFTVRGARLTVALQIQEATLQSFFDQSGALARGSGFLARFLVAWPESTQGSRPFTEAPDAWPSLAAFNRRVTVLLNQRAPIDEDGALTPQVLNFAPDTKSEWIAFHDRVERQLASGGRFQDVRDVASKVADNAARLAALFHVFEDGLTPVGAGSFRAAVQIVEWHLTEALRFFGELAMPVGLADAARLEAWLIVTCQRRGVDHLSFGEVQRYGPSRLRDKGTLTAAVVELADLGRARLITARPKLIAVNPSLLTPATAIPAIFATVSGQVGSDRSKNSENSCSSTSERIDEEGLVDELALDEDTI